MSGADIDNWRPSADNRPVLEQDSRFNRYANGLAGIPFRLRIRPPFHTPRKILILKPGFLSHVMLTTPLVTVLNQAFPEARIDWAVSDWARPAVAANPRLSELISTGRFGQPGLNYGEVRTLATRLRRERYDTCFIPSRSRLLALVASLAGIPQRIGLDVNGGGFAHTVRVSPPPRPVNEAQLYLELARAIDLPGDADMEFYAPDSERTRVTQMLVDETEWRGEVPLVILHPGGGANPWYPESDKCWPYERYALLGNHLVREHRACVLVVGAEEDRALANAVVGLMSAQALNYAGRLSLAQLGALSELAHLYVGNDTGASHVAAAVGCPTLVMFGPTDVTVSRPYVKRGPVMCLPALKHVMGHLVDDARPFSWDDNLNADEACIVADQLLSRGYAEPAPAAIPA